VTEAKGSSKMSLLFCQTTPCRPRRQYPAWSLPLENQSSHKFKCFDDGFTMIEAVLLDAGQDFLYKRTTILLKLDYFSVLRWTGYEEIPILLGS